jgi:MtN3 and saliva related transmembrane protein
MIIELIGYSAAILTASTMIPQIRKSIQTKHVEDISLAMIIMYTINTGLWVMYGLLIGAHPVVLADGLACCMGITQFILKLKYGKK